MVSCNNTALPRQLLLNIKGSENQPCPLRDKHSNIKDSHEPRQSSFVTGHGHYNTKLPTA